MTSRPPAADRAGSPPPTTRPSCSPAPRRCPRRPRTPRRPRQQPSAAPATRTWTQRVRGNGGLVGAALALVLFSGVGGFAVGHATAGPDRFGLVGRAGPRRRVPRAGRRTASCPPPRHGRRRRRLRHARPDRTTTAARGRPASSRAARCDRRSRPPGAGAGRSARRVPPGPRSTPHVRLAAGAGLWLSLLLVSYWWAAAGGITDLGRLGHRAHLARPAHRPGRVRPAAGAGAADGPAAGARGRLRPGPARAPAPGRRVHLVHPDAGAHRPHQLGVRRRQPRRDGRDVLEPHAHLPGHAARPRRHRSRW